MIPHHGLGRLAAPDPRDHLMTLPMPGARAAAAVRLQQRYWGSSWWGDQGATSQCVAYAWSHYLTDGPVVQLPPRPPQPPQVVYDAAQLIDEWAPAAHDGTSVRAGAKVLQQLGFITDYQFAFDLATVVDAVLLRGPVVMGTNWYDRMFDPDPKTGLVTVDGPLAGGHAWKLDGVNKKSGMARAKNSWGRHWGRGGYFTISFADLERLIHESGEAAIATEVQRAHA